MPYICGMTPLTPFASLLHKASICIIALYWLCLLASCEGKLSDKSQKLGKPPLDERQVMLILADLHTAQAIVQIYPQRDRQLPNTLDEYYSQVLCMHNASAADFEASFKHYSEDPYTIGKIYDEVQSQLNYIENLVKERGAKTPTPPLPTTAAAPATPTLKSPTQDSATVAKMLKGLNKVKPRVLKDSDK